MRAIGAERASQPGDLRAAVGDLATNAPIPIITTSVAADISALRDPHKRTRP